MSSTTMALIMAGGQGTRMRASGVATPKPLTEILGVTALERNLHALIRHDIRRVAIAIPNDIPDIERFARGRALRLAHAAGLDLEIFIEGRPLGNIGCAGLWRDRTDALLVVYADNLTTLDLAEVLAAHEASGADLTLATHMHPFRMPFGEIRSDGGEVRAYVEKPVYRFPVASAVSVLGPVALDSLAADRPIGLSGLAQGLIDGGRRVREYRHAAPWIDVNDATAIGEAEALVGRHQADFDTWARPPMAEIRVALSIADESVRNKPHAKSDAAAFVFDDLDDDRLMIRRVHVHLTASKTPHVDGEAEVSALGRRALAIAAHRPHP